MGQRTPAVPLPAARGIAMEDRTLEDKIKRVNWKELHTASGSAEEVPLQLEQLTSCEKAQRELAYWNLDNHIVRQGDLFSAALYVTPVLIEMLREKVPLGKLEILELLTEIVLAAPIPEEELVICGGAEDPFYGNMRLARRSLANMCRKVIHENLNAILPGLKAIVIWNLKQPWNCSR